DCVLHCEPWGGCLQCQSGESEADYHTEQASRKDECHDENDCLGHYSCGFSDWRDLVYRLRNCSRWHYWSHRYGRRCLVDSPWSNIQAQEATRARGRLSFVIIN